MQRWIGLSCVRADPFRQRIEHGIHDLRIRASGARGHVERMIGIVEQLQASRARRGVRSTAAAARGPRARRACPAGTASAPRTSARCAARSSDGLPAGCSGKPRKTRPRTPGSGAAACACDVMRPPNDLPPAKSGTPGSSACRFGDGRAHGRVRELRRVGALRAVLHVRKLVAQRRDAARGESLRDRWP